MIYICYFLIGLLSIRLLVAVSNYLSFAYLPQDATLVKEPHVSILIPARDEEENIGTLLEQLSSLEYGQFEIIVYNDNSTDSTEAIVRHWATLVPKIKLINGQGLPPGWLGKNQACHQLSKVAKGTILLFLDADVRVQKHLLKRSIAHFQKYELQLLSIFPKQIMKSFGEKISVSLMNWILLSLLPLQLVRTSKNEAFSAANGQFLMFNAATYKTFWPHEKFKSHRVEDMAIMKLFKQKGLAGATLLGDDAISCRMYDGLGVAIEGFSKNIFQFFGNSIVVTILFGVITTIAPFIIFVTMGFWWFSFYIAGIVSIRFFVSLASQQSVVQNVLLAFPQHLIFLVIILKGLINNNRKKLLWKGRNILQDH